VYIHTHLDDIKGVREKSSNRIREGRNYHCIHGIWLFFPPSPIIIFICISYVWVVVGVCAKEGGAGRMRESATERERVGIGDGRRGKWVHACV